MKKSMFNQNITPSCAYCENYIFGNDVSYCIKGKQMKHDKCRKFKYDPIMRVPKTAKIEHKFTSDDFRL